MWSKMGSVLEKAPWVDEKSMHLWGPESLGHTAALTLNKNQLKVGLSFSLLAGNAGFRRKPKADTTQKGPASKRKYLTVQSLDKIR